jgi:hypothetical protein
LSTGTHEHPVGLLVGIFAKVPDVTLPILSISVMGHSLQGTVFEDCVNYFHAGHTHEDPTTAPPLAAKI